jgi:hypothetical protein
VEVTGEFTVTVRAKVAGLQVLRNGVALALSGVVTGPGMKTFAAPTSGTYTVVNTGNVPLRPEVFHYVSEGTTTEKAGTAFELLPGQTRDITEFMDPNGFGTHIEFFDTGAVLVTPVSSRIVDTLEAFIFMQRPL